MAIDVYLHVTVGQTGCVVAGSVIHHKSDRVVVTSEVVCMGKKYRYM